MEAPTIFVVRPGDIIYLPQPILLKTAPVSTIEPKSPASLTKQHFGMEKPTSASESSDPTSSDCSNIPHRPHLSNAELALQTTAMITTPSEAEITILKLMQKYSFSLRQLIELLREKRLDVSFSKVKYLDIAPLVSLDPSKEGEDIDTFSMSRARLPDTVFQQILVDLHTLHFNMDQFPNTAMKKLGPDFCPQQSNRTGSR